MRHRPIALTLALGLLAAPRPAEAQKGGKMYRVGWLGPYERAYTAMAFRLHEIDHLNHAERALKAARREARRGS